ncbi:hypothetical protein AAF134_13875 [Synechococcus lacustris Tous-12m]
MNALSLEATARSLAQEFDLELTVLDEQGCREKGMGAFLAVAQGACVPPASFTLLFPPRGLPCGG